MFSEYFDGKENSDVLSGLTDMFDDNGYNKRLNNEKNLGQPNSPKEDSAKIEKKSENENLENAKNKANEWYKVLSNAYPGGFEINQNGNESTKVSLLKSGTDFSIRVSRIQKENDAEIEIDSGILNFENIFPKNSDRQGGDQNSTAQTDKDPVPSFSVTGNNALLSQLFPTQKGQNNGGLDIANQDFCSVVDALGNSESIITKEINSVYGYVDKYLNEFRKSYNDNSLTSLDSENNDLDENNKVINFILNGSSINRELFTNDSLFIRKALLSSCIVLRSGSNNIKTPEINQALGIINNLKKPDTQDKASLTSGEDVIELLTLGNETGNVTSIISNLDILVEGAISCINGDSDMEEDMKNQILNLLNKQND